MMSKHPCMEMPRLPSFLIDIPNRSVNAWRRRAQNSSFTMLFWLLTVLFHQMKRRWPTINGLFGKNSGQQYLPRSTKCV
ncbi:hypothetical protein OSTOST_12072 [Ostertagia ostertagi]